MNKQVQGGHKVPKGEYVLGMACLEQSLAIRGSILAIGPLMHY